MIAAPDSLNHNHSLAEPGMPRIVDPFDRSTMGFVLSSSTIGAVRT